MGLFQKIFGGGQAVDLKTAITKNTFLVDVREPGEFVAGSAKGAVNIPLGSLPMQLSKFKDKENIVVFCRSGNRSGQAKLILEKNGFTNVINGGTWGNVKQFVQ